MDKKILSKYIFGAILLLLAACSQEELTEQGNTLPEGKYPLEIASVTMSVESGSETWGNGTPQTRVSENTDGKSSTWDWDGTEKIGVQLYADGDVATYTLNTNKTLTSDQALYWKDTKQTTVTAWYPVETEVSLADQSEKLAYVLKGSGTGDYNNPVVLGFEHALAKICMVLTGNKASEVNNVSIKGYTVCTHTDGGTVSGKSEGEIKMHPVGNDTFEANVVPGKEIAEFKVNDGDWVNLSTLVTPIAGNYHKITIDVESKDVTITGDYTITGEHKPLIIDGNGTVTFKDARITSDDRPVIKINDGCTPTLVFKGTNVLKCNWDSPRTGGGITSGEDDEYSIKLENGAKLAVISIGCTPIGSTYNQIRLKISGNGEMWVQSNLHDTPAIIVHSGSLSISDGVDLTAVAADVSWNNGRIDYIPAIGRTSYVGARGGTITLNNCTLKLYARTSMGNATLQNWVTLENGTVTPDVDAALKDAAWDKEVDLGNGVKVTKLKERPTPPDWAQY